MGWLASLALCRFPRTRGDEPKPSAAQKLVKEFPRTRRGWVLKNKAELSALHFLSATLFQARGGYRLGTQILTSQNMKDNPSSTPRTRGDEPRSRWNRKRWAFSPRVESCCYFKPGGGYQPSGSILSNRSAKGTPGSLAFVMPEKPGTRSSRPRANSTRTPQPARALTSAATA